MLRIGQSVLIVHRIRVGLTVACAVVGALAVHACAKQESVKDSVADTGVATGRTAAQAGWVGRYVVRGTTEDGGQATGTLAVLPLEPGSADYDSTNQRVRRTYPSYAGPLYRADLALAARDSLQSSFTCADSPASPPSLVCHPTAPLAGLHDAALIVQPDGRAVLSGSHGEGVTVQYGRFSWERAPGA
jgi:hypothetical protein